MPKNRCRAVPGPLAFGRWNPMSSLAQIITAVEAFDHSVESQVRKARSDAKFGAELRRRWRKIRRRVPVVETPTGLNLPRLALPQTDEPGEIARYLYGEGLPGEFPFANGAYREMYLQEQPKSEIRNPKCEEPTRLFAGLGLAEDSNQRFHYLTRHQKNIRLSTAFDGPTLCGLDSDAHGVFGKIGEGGVAIDTLEDVERLYARFP